GIYGVRPNGNDLRKVSEFHGDLACYDLEPSWSPSGRRLVFAVICDGGNLGIWPVNLDGTHRTELVGTSEHRGLVSAAAPQWSPDGKTIAFLGVRERSHNHYTYGLFTVRPDGTGL